MMKSFFVIIGCLICAVSEASPLKPSYPKRAEESHRNTFAGKREQAEEEYLERDNRALFPDLARYSGMEPLEKNALELAKAIDWNGVEAAYKNLTQIIETARMARGISGREGDLNEIQKKFLEDWTSACSRLNAHYEKYQRFKVSLEDVESRNLFDSYFDEEASKKVPRTFGSTAKTLVEKAGGLVKDVGLEFPYALILPNRYRGFGAATTQELKCKGADESHRNTFAGKREQAEKGYLNGELFPSLATDFGMGPLKTKAGELTKAIDWKGVETVYKKLTQIIETARMARGMSGKEGNLNIIQNEFLEDWTSACSRLNAYYKEYREFRVSLEDDISRNLFDSYFDEEASKTVPRTFGSTSKTLVEKAGGLAKDVGVEFPYDLILSNRYRGFGMKSLKTKEEELKRSHDSSKKEKRKICTCTPPDEFFAGVCKKKVGVIRNKLWAQYYCRNCGEFRRGSMFELRQTDKGVSVYPARSVPSDWDGKIYEQSELEAHARELRNSVKAERENVVEEKVNTDVNQQPRTNDSQVGIRGWCKCQKKNIDDGLAQVGPWFYDSFGREKYDELEIECDLAYFICCKCGRVVHPNDRTLRNQDLPIFDVKLYKMILAQDKNIVWRKAAVPLKNRLDQLAAIPDGQIVVHGKCVCKKENAHLVHVGHPKDGDFHVCIICGHVRSPDAIAGIPCEEKNE